MRWARFARAAALGCAALALAGESQSSAAEGAAPRSAAHARSVGLDAYLNAELREQRRRAAIWRRVLGGEADERAAAIEALRAELLGLLRPWPGPRLDLEPRSSPWFARDGVEARLVQITTHPGVRLGCALLLPTPAASPPRPALLVLHGMGGTLRSVVEDVDYHHGFGFELARRGFIVLAPFRVASTPALRTSLHAKALAAGWSLEAIELWQLVRALDYLFSLDAVDPQRVGVYGISLGGQQALELLAVDARPSLAVTSAWFTERFAWLFQRHPGDASRPPTSEMAGEIAPEELVGLLPSMGVLLDDLNLVALIQPRHLAIVAGTRDPRYPGARREFEQAMRLYERVGAPERLAFFSFAGGHETSLASVVPFLERWAASPAGGAER